MKTNLIIDSVDTNGKAKSKAITNINPAATNAQLQEVAQRLTALTTNTYAGATRVNIQSVTEDDVGGGVTKKVPTLILNDVSNLFQGDTFTVTYDGDGEIRVYGEALDGSAGPEYLGNNIVKCGRDLGGGVVYVEETDNYYSAAVGFGWSD